MSGFATTGVLSETATGAAGAAGTEGVDTDVATGAGAAGAATGKGSVVLVVGLGAVTVGEEVVVAAAGLGAATGAFVGAATTGRVASAPKKKIPIVKNRQVVQRLIFQLRKGKIQAKL